MMTISPERIIRQLRKTPLLLQVILKDVSQDKAERLTDGPGGWNVLYTVCHMCDVSEGNFERVQRMVQEDKPSFWSLDPDITPPTRDYRLAKLDDEVAAYIQSRQKLIGFLAALSPEQWDRRGVHSEFGEMDLRELALGILMHDVNHMEQIARTLQLVDTNLPT